MPARTTSRETRRARICSRFSSIEREFVVDSGASMHMMSKQKLSSEEMDTVKKVQNPCCGGVCQWWSAHSRGGTGVRLWLESVRHRAHTGGDACCLIARQALRRLRIFLWVGQLSKATIDPKWENYNLQDGQLRTSCRSKVIRQFWEQFAPYIANSRIIENQSIPSLWKQSCFEFIFIENPKQTN